MNGKQNVKIELLIALLAGVTLTALYYALLFTRSFHGFAVKALGPAIDLVRNHLDPKYFEQPYSRLEVLLANAALYTFWIFIITAAVGFLRQRLSRKVHG